MKNENGKYKQNMRVKELKNIFDEREHQHERNIVHYEWKMKIV